LDKHDRAAGEEPPVGLILCAQANIRVAEYLAHIPDMEMLQAQLHRAVALAREHVAQARLPMNES
jgi:hypothetical protein